MRGFTVLTLGPVWPCGPLGPRAPLRPCNKTISFSLKLQNRTTTKVTNSPYDTSALPLLKNLDWLTVRELIDFENSDIVYLSFNAVAPD